MFTSKFLTLKHASSEKAAETTTMPTRATQGECWEAGMTRGNGERKRAMAARLTATVKVRTRSSRGEARDGNGAIATAARMTA
jgi:hypothetical protein